MIVKTIKSFLKLRLFLKIFWSKGQTLFTLIIVIGLEKTFGERKASFWHCDTEKKFEKMMFQVREKRCPSLPISMRIPSRIFRHCKFH